MKRLLPLLFVMSSLLGCKNDTVISKISGTLYLNCNNPAVNLEVGLKTIGVNGNSESLILGSAITNTNGEFNFTYEVDDKDAGEVELILFQNQGYSTIIKNLPLKRDLGLENLYMASSSSLILTLGGEYQFTANDTLFYGISNPSTISYQLMPENGTLDTLLFNFDAIINGNTLPLIVCYGIGQSDYNKSLEAANITDSSYQNIELKLLPCTTIEVDSIIIN